MGFSLKGYVVERPRVGGANSPFTLTPDVFISDAGDYSTAYPATETAPRTDYLVLALADGKLPDALFGWTKNEGLVAGGPAVQRFDFDGKKQSFAPLPGGAPFVAGVISSEANTTRLKVPVPIGVTSEAPFRLSVGTIGSGITLDVSLVSSFGSPSAGTVELLTLGSSAGELNWNPADLATYDGQTVRFQRQSFFKPKESNGKLGLIENDTLLLTPIPGAGQEPLIRIGFGLWLVAEERANEAAFSVNPTAGHVEWARDTGLLKFNSDDLTANAGRSVYYDGVLFARNVALPRQSLGTVNASGDTDPQDTVITNVPPEGGDLIFRVPGEVQFAEAVRVTEFDSVGKQGQVQYNSDGEVQLSLADRIAYGGQPLEVVLGDLPLERGLSMRFFRTPVDLSGSDPTLKDVSTIYDVSGATWADPIVAMPQVFLPSVPIDASSHPITVTVAQGTGSFLGTLPRLDVVGPPAGLGYVIDFDQNILQYARRHNNHLISLEQPSQVGVLPDPLAIDSQATFELETAPGSGTFIALVRDVDYLLDVTAGQVLFTSTSGALRAQGSSGAFSSTTFTDNSVDFAGSGVQVGDFLIVRAGAAEGVYTIVGVGANQLTTDLSGGVNTNVPYEVRSGKEVLADRYFQEVLVVDPKTKLERVYTLGVITNSPRRAVQDANAISRFRFGTSTFSQSVVTVSDDGDFTLPENLSAGTVEVSLDTGNVNFSDVDVAAGGTVYAVRKLTQGKDYRMSPILGFIEFTDRMLAGEEAIVTYASTTDPSVIIEEPVTFLVRKEQVQSHPNPTSTLAFNPTGHRVATTPPPMVFRGGRPQVSGQHVTVNTSTSTITFLPDGQLTDALPHGATVAPNERILVDYHIYDAIGGEKTTSVLRPPVNLARVLIAQGSDSFAIVGDYASSFPADHLLRVDRDQVYLIGSSTYDAATEKTTVVLGGGQKFSDDYVDPKLFVTSGPVRTTSAPSLPSYFSTELSAYEPVARGMNVLKIVGDRTASYKSNAIVLFTDGVGTDIYRVNGAKYVPETNRTEVSLTTNAARQYSTHTLKCSVRPVFDESLMTVNTSLTPALTFPGDPDTLQYSLFRRTEGQVGELLSSPADYTIDNAGVVSFNPALQPNEEISIFYTGLRMVPAGLRLRASYTHITAPTAANGVENQVLQADYSTFNPDSFYFRVESMTNFRGETAAEIEKQAKSSAPSGGPQTSNSSSPQLTEQGRESVFYQEGHLANQDIIARAILKFYNDAVNHLEDALQAIDGRVVGDRHGRFKFDGNIDNPVRTTVASVTNQIDDLLQVSPFPPPNGTTQPIYQTGPYSRFFCTRRNLFAGPTVAGNDDGDPIAKFAFKGLSSTPGELRRRAPRAQILKDYPAGTTIFEVDNATGTSDSLLRPAFVTNMRVVIQDADGTFYIDASEEITVSGVSAGPPQTITLSGAPAVPVPAGATIYLSPSDASDTLSDGDQDGYAMVYKIGKDVEINRDSGEVLFVERVFPFDGTVPETFIPKILLINEVPADDILQCNGAGLFATNTEPYKFPALFGGTTDDDGDQAVPLVGPTFEGEITAAGGGPVNDEKLIIEASTGTIRTATTPSYVGTGSLNAARTIITDAVAYGGTVPQVNDVVRILSGLNGTTDYRRITSVGASTVTVDSPFATQDSNFTYTVAVSALSVTGTATLSGTTLTDGSATFLSNGARVGHTVILTNGGDVGCRRQIVAIVSNTELTLDVAFPTAANATYRVANALGTFGGAGSIQADLSSALAAQVATGSGALQTALSAFLATLFTTLESGAGGTVSSGTLSTFTDATADFVASGVNSSHFVYVPSGTHMGVYQVASVDSPTQLTLATPFGGAAAGLSYQVVSVFGVGKATLEEVLDLISGSDPFLASTQAFKSLVDTSVTVLRAGVADAGAFARGLLTTDLDARVTDVEGRLTSLADPASGPIARIQNILSGTERLYDKRFTWIDTRINLENGLLVRQKRAIEDRIKNQANVLKQLIKLLAVKE